MNLSNLIEKFQKNLELKCYSPLTIRSYKNSAFLFLKENPNIPPKQIQEKEVEKFIYDKIKCQNISKCFQKHLVSGIKLFYLEVFNKHLLIDYLIPVIKINKLPYVLTIAEVKIIIDADKNIKHKAILYTIYSAGLKLGELINMKILDVDSQRMIININQVKGVKHREVALSSKLFELLKEYRKSYKPVEWLFEGIKGNQFSKRSVQQIFNNNVCKIGIEKKATVNTLRHSYAAHLFEAGIDIRNIQELLGHNSIKSTQIYSHVTNAVKSKIKSPLDL